MGAMGLSCIKISLSPPFQYLSPLEPLHLSLKKTSKRRKNGSEADLIHLSVSKDSIFGLFSQISDDFHGLHPSLQLQVSPFLSTVEKDLIFLLHFPLYLIGFCVPLDFYRSFLIWAAFGFVEPFMFLSKFVEMLLEFVGFYSSGLGFFGFIYLFIYLIS